MNTPVEQALRLIASELKAVRVSQGKIMRDLKTLGGNMSGMQVALSEREKDFSDRYEQLQQKDQRNHERLTRVERALKLRTA